MASWKLLILFGLVLTSGLYKIHADEDAEDSTDAEDDEDYADADRAHLIVRKYIDAELGVQGRNLTISIELYNAGNSEATGVEIVDAELPDGLELLEGSLTASFARIDQGSSVKHVYVVKGVKGETGHYLDAAKVTYKADPTGSEQVGHSSRTGIYVMTPAEQITRYALIAGRYASLGMARTPTDWRNLAIVLFVVVGVYGVNEAVKGASTARTNQRRKKALELLEKEQ